MRKAYFLLAIPIFLSLAACQPKPEPATGFPSEAPLYGLLIENPDSWLPEQKDSTMQDFLEIWRMRYAVQDSQDAARWIDRVLRLGVYAYQQNAPDQALSYFLDALEMALDYHIEDPYVSGNIAGIYADAMDFSRAWEMNWGRYSQLEQAGDYLSAALDLNTMLTCAMGMGDTAKVRQCAKAMLRKPYDTIPTVQFSLERAGMFLDMKRGKYRQALIHARNEAAYADCFTDTTAFLASVYQDIALMNARMQRYDSALWYYDKALEANLTERRIPALKRIYRQEAEIYKRLGQHQAYYDKMEAFMELSRYSDSLARAERHENLDYVILQRAQARKMMQIQYEVLYKDKIIKKQRLLATGSALLFLLVSALLFLLYQSKRKKERTNRLLYEKTKQLLDLSQAQTERWKALATGLDLPTEDVSMPLEDSMPLDENSGHDTLPVSGESEIPDEANPAKEAKGFLSSQAASFPSRLQDSLKATDGHSKAPHSETAGLHPETPHSGQVSHSDKIPNIEQDSRLDQTRIRQLIAGILQLLEKEECWLQPDFTIEKAAKQLGTNSSYLSYVVNHHLGKSFSTLLNEYRVRRACLLMEDPANATYTMDYLAMQAGFSNRVTLLRQFKRMVGMAPSEYWKMARHPKPIINQSPLREKEEGVS